MKKNQYIIILLFQIIAAPYLFSQKNLAEREKFVSALMKKMTLEEKIGQLNLVTPGSDIPTGSTVSTGVEEKLRTGFVGGMFGIHGTDKIKSAQDLALKSRLKIPLIVGSDVIHGYETTFPIPLGLACSWDTTLIQQSAQIAAKEASANGVYWTFSPMVDIARDPRWGRVAESAGEDAFLGSQVAKVMVKGYQGDLSKNYNILACVKHFALYGAAEAGRDYNTTDMSRIRMYQDYFPPYKAAIDAGVGSVMSSFNEIDGIPATGNKWLLTEVLRNQWGFKGFVVSDYTAVNEMTDHGTGDLKQNAAMALNAGLDMDMVGEGFLTTLKASLKEKKISEQQINTACKRILEAKYDLGLFTDPFRYIDASRPAKEILTQEHRDFARKMAAHSFVLLKNEKQTLPLRVPGRIALIGPMAHDRSNMLGTWAVGGDPMKSVSVLEGMKSVFNGSKIIFTKGCNISNDTVLAKNVNVFGTKIDIDKRTPIELLDEALFVAKNADVIVAVVGEASEMTGESASRTALDLPESQKLLIRELKKTGKPLVLVLLAGRPLTISEELGMADALLYVWHAGTEAGNAIADVLHGDYNPSGKLTMTFPQNVGQIPIYYNYKRTGRPQSGNVFQKFRSNYLDASNEPLLPFGYGLSYTTFSYGDIQLSSNTVTDKNGLMASVKVTNSGDYDGEEVVQLYIQDIIGSVTRPVKELKAFQKVFLRKGETKTITFPVTVEQLKFYNYDLKFVAEEGDFKLFIGTNSKEVKEANFNYKK